jgi:hypothetical protein
VFQASLSDGFLFGLLAGFIRLLTFWCGDGHPVGEGAMPTYRVMLVDENGEYKGAEVMVCADDQAALDHAQQYVDGCDVEVWRQDRLVARLRNDRPDSH